jgi:putative phosphoribosyl transferase
MRKWKGFADRREAGRWLAKVTRALNLCNPVVLALPRGGVPVAFEVAKTLGAPMDVLLVRKISAPGQEEYGIGAVIDGASPPFIIDFAAARLTGADQNYIDHQVTLQLAEIERRRALYCTHTPINLAGRDVIVVDDGIANGGTMRAALTALGKVGARRLVLAVPIGPAKLLAELGELCDRVVYLLAPRHFHAVGAHYCNFAPVSDAEVVNLLAKARDFEGACLHEAY